MIEFPPWFRLVAATTIGFPLLQAAIYFLGATINVDLLNQFSWDGSNRDSREDMIFAIVLLGGAQGCLGFLCGLSTTLALLTPALMRRTTLLCVNALGAFTCGWFLFQNWNFEANHGGNAVSPLIFDFVMVTFFALPLTWNLSVFCFAFFARSLKL